MSSIQKIKPLRLSADKMGSQEGVVIPNLELATGLVQQAALDGAELVLLPEFMPGGHL